MLYLHITEIPDNLSHAEAARALHEAGVRLRDQMLAAITDAPCTIAVTPTGKPYLESPPGIAFSISHSGTHVACAVLITPETHAVGVDIERITSDSPRLRRIAARCFTEAECTLYCQTDYAPLTFFRIWTRKESYLKCTGQGLSGGLRQTNTQSPLQIHNHPYKFQEKQTSGYIVTVCVPEETGDAKDAPGGTF